jgi:single-strand DNA-binding protein
LWRYLAEKNLIKGDQIYLEGRIRSRSYDATDGTKRYITEIQGDKILKLASPSVSQSKGPIEEDNQAPPPEYEGSDDLPF